MNKEEITILDYSVYSLTEALYRLNKYYSINCGDLFAYKELILHPSDFEALCLEYDAMVVYREGDTLVVKNDIMSLKQIKFSWGSVRKGLAEDTIKNRIRLPYNPVTGPVTVLLPVTD